MTKQRNAKSSRHTARRLAVRKTDRTVGDDTRHAMIDEATHLLAKQRGFEGSMQLDDWLRVEQEINAPLSASE